MQKLAHDWGTPIILTDGRPGSIIEQLKKIGPLTDPRSSLSDWTGDHCS
jgi:hypothetical protein